MRHFLILISVLFSVFSFAQENKKVETDTSIIETMYHPDFNSIGVFNVLKDKSRTYYTEFYYDTKKLKEEGMFIGDTAVGIWKEFSQNGNLIREIHLDKGIITYFDKKAFPFLELQNSYKLKGDSIIKKIYSQEFFNTHVVWSLLSSSVYNDEESGDWTDEFKKRPTKFLLRYNIKFDGKIYDDIIEFEINSKGQFIPNQYEDIYGFEQLSKDSPKTFKLKQSNAIELAKRMGLQETDSAKAEGLLHWESFKSKSIYNGRYRFYVLIKTNSIKDIRPGGRSSVTDKFDVYVFNPWTSEFVEKRKMKAIRSWEAMSGSSTGLLPDNE
jgi:hypothetical protein